MAKPKTTTRQQLSRTNADDSPTLWFAKLESALRNGDKRAARECRGHLVRLGVDVAEFDISVVKELEDAG